MPVAGGAGLGAAPWRLPWGEVHGTGPAPATAAPAASLWHCALKKIHRVVSRQFTP